VEESETEDLGHPFPHQQRIPSGEEDSSMAVDGVFWYTKHVHYTLVWMCLWN
jgi:hypothetical protein